MKILADATIPMLTPFFPPPFKITCYKNNEQLHAGLSTHDILLCRATLMVNRNLLANSTIRCVATATSGIDHIDCDYLTTHNIALFDAKGSNAQSVADYVVACLAYLTRHKHLHGDKAGIIGMGEVGTRVASRLQAAGFDVAGYDPIRASHDTPFVSCSWEEITQCDLVCVHANFHTKAPYPSQNMLNTVFFSTCKPHLILINTARGGIVDENALLSTETPITYCTDVYLSEPDINARIVDKATLCTPHIAGHSIEAKLKAVEKISHQLHQFYHLPMPDLLPQKTSPTPFAYSHTHWYDTILDVYNPVIETHALKTAKDIKTAFLTQRASHILRHNFTTYNASHYDRLTQQLLGHTSAAESSKEKE